MPTGTVERDDQGRKRARWAPWMLLGPGLIFLFIFFSRRCRPFGHSSGGSNILQIGKSPFN
jgi:hypothetical protein